MSRKRVVSTSSLLFVTVFVAASAVVIPAARPVWAATGEGLCPSGTAEGALTWGTTGEAVWDNSVAHQSGGASETYVDVAGSVDMTLSYTDPDNRNEDLDNPLLNLGPLGWDPPILTQTDGVRGSDALTIAMNSLNDDEVLTWVFDFSKPVIIPSLVVNDIDSTGYGIVPSDVPHHSFQDQVVPVAERGGNSVTIGSSLGAALQADGLGGFVSTYGLGVDADLAYTDPAGWLTLAATDPITSLSLAYSNGPDDAAAEATAATSGGATWPSPIPQSSRGVSNNHAIGVSNFAICTGTLTIGQNVWADVDGDGVQDGSEPGVSGVSVYLRDLANNLIETQVTDANGDYTFTEVPPFTWVISIDLPTGYTNTGDRDGTPDGTTTLTTMTSSIGDADFAIQPPDSAISGLVLADRNNNGDLDLASNDTPLAGVTINLVGTDLAGNPVSDTTTTAANGTYSFSAPAGNYLVNEVAPSSGYNDGIDTPGTSATVNANDSHAVLLGIDSSSVGNNFAEIPTSSLSGTSYEDLDEDGVPDPGEDGIVGVLITLTGTDDGGNAVSISETTGAGGLYSFSQLRPGTYSVTQTHPTGYTDGLDAVGSSGGVLANDEVSGINLAVATAASGYDFGEIVDASLAGTVATTAGDGIPGVSVRLTGIDHLGAPVDSTILTDAAGAYSFEAILPGTYVITETQPAGYGDAAESLGSLGGAVGEDVFSAIVVLAGDDGMDYDFSESTSSIAGTVFSDLNADGDLNGAETGIESVSVRVTGTDVLGAPVDRTVTTAADGTFDFVGLRAGTYTVSESQPSAYTDGQDSAGDSGGVLSDDSVSAISLPAGTDYSGLRFAEIGGSLAGTVFADSNNDGIHDTGELGIEAVSVQLSGITSDGGPFDVTLVTNASGDYVFNNVPSGTYALRETQPASHIDGVDTSGSVGGDGSTSDQVTSINFSASDSAVGYDFGELLASSLSGRVVDSFGGPIEAVTINLAGSDDLGPVSTSTTTAADGTFAFTGLRPGTYVLTEVQPAAFADGDDLPGSAGGTTASNDQIAAILLNQGTNAVDYVFVEHGALVTGRVALDANNNGFVDSWETEHFVGVRVDLVSGSTVIASTVTIADGSYEFHNVEPGNYTVRQHQPEGWVSTTDDEVAVLVTTGGIADVNFGERGGRLLGHVFVDANGDGRDDGAATADEAGLAGLIVRLLTADGTEIASTFTDAAGDYVFEHLEAGTYEISFATVPEMAWTVANVGPIDGGAPDAASDQVDSDADPVSGSITATLMAGEERPDNDAGLVVARYDLSVGISVDAPTLNIGASSAVQIRVTNSGTAPVLGGLQISFPIPANTEFVSATGEGWVLTFDDGELVGTRSTPLAPSDQAPPVFVTLRTTTSGSFYPAVEVAPADDLTEVTMANNAASSTVVVVSTSSLAQTGVSTLAYLMVAGLLMLVGFLLHLWSRRLRSGA